LDHGLPHRKRKQKQAKKIGIDVARQKPLFLIREHCLNRVQHFKHCVMSYGTFLRGNRLRVDRGFVVITVIYNTGLKEMVDRRRRVGRWM
jgi:hypothetical protein